MLDSRCQSCRRDQGVLLLLLVFKPRSGGQVIDYLKALLILMMLALIAFAEKVFLLRLGGRRARSEATASMVKIISLEIVRFLALSNYG